MSQCVNQPISWLKLEMYALSELDSRAAAEVEEHLQACSACRSCAGSIESAQVSGLPPLPQVREQPPRWPRWQWALVPALAAALLLLWIGRDRERGLELGERVKGGSLEMVLIRESGGRLMSATRFADGDRFKVEVSCAPGTREFLDVVVFQDGEVFFPLEPVAIECSNNVALPGAFRLSGAEAEVCIARGGDSAPVRAEVRRDAEWVGPCRAVSPVPE